MGHSPCMSPYEGVLRGILGVLFLLFLCFPREIEHYEIMILKKGSKSQKKFLAEILCLLGRSLICGGPAYICGEKAYFGGPKFSTSSFP